MGKQRLVYVWDDASHRAALTLEMRQTDRQTDTDAPFASLLNVQTAVST